MAATSPAKRQSPHHPGGGKYGPKPWGMIFFAAALFFAAWAVWTLFFGSALPR